MVKSDLPNLIDVYRFNTQRINLFASRTWQCFISMNALVFVRLVLSFYPPVKPGSFFDHHNRTLLQMCQYH
jgi:hypothetical protein